MNNENLVLRGFMGVGKSSVARELAKSLDMFNLDCDDLIQNYEGLTIPKIFELKGEMYFRNLEKKLSGFLIKNVRNSVISTGGGFVNVKNLHKIGKIIYLKASFDFIIQRLKGLKNSKKNFNKRPLLKNLKQAKELFSKREEIYEKKADIIIYVQDKTIRQIAKEIRTKIKDKI